MHFIYAYFLKCKMNNPICMYVHLVTDIYKQTMQSPFN